MNQVLKYVPVFRGLQEEFKVLQQFDFKKNIYPWMEIVQETDHDRGKKEKTFEQSYYPIIENIKAQKIFIDLPLKVRPIKNMKPKMLDFASRVISNREERTNYLKKFSPYKTKVIPVISSYSRLTTERNSIRRQENELREIFPVLAFRTWFDDFVADIDIIKTVLRKGDYLMVDFEHQHANHEDPDNALIEIMEELNSIEATVIIHRNPFPSNLTYAHLENDSIVTIIDNELMNWYDKVGGHCFSDYAGIKRNELSNGGSISPAFCWYDGTRNNFLGYRFLHGGHKKGEIKPRLAEFETTIVPGILASSSTGRMNRIGLLALANQGWMTIQRIAGHVRPKESGQSQAKFKKIGMDHYLYCMQRKIEDGDFD